MLGLLVVPVQSGSGKQVVLYLQSVSCTPLPPGIIVSLGP